MFLTTISSSFLHFHVSLFPISSFPVPLFITTHCQGIRYQLHYLDDFLFIGAPDSQQGREYQSLALQTLAQLGVTVAAHKTQGPSTALTFLGILVNTSTFELHLPGDKLTCLQDAIQQWACKHACTQRDLESFLGHLSHAATVIPQGRVYLSQLFPLLSRGQAPHHYIRLNLCTLADLFWWQAFSCSAGPTVPHSISNIGPASPQ